MKKTRTTLARQRGALFIVMATVLVLGFAWFVVAALGKTGVTQADKDAKTAAALQAAKRALLSHVAHYAARTDFDFPGRMPCPESLSALGDPDEDQHGVATGTCSSAPVIGRLPWKTLGIDQLRDADGEPLWYALSTGFHPVPTKPPAAPPPPLNFGTPAALQYDPLASPTASPSIMVVAVILAPGRALKTNPCPGVVQTINRYAVPLDPRKFLECGNKDTPPVYKNRGSDSSPNASNDRVLAITKEEWADAIAGAVADRIQRQVAPAMNDFWKTISPASWGQQYLPYASIWNSPASAPPTNDLCGNDDTNGGMPPTATAGSGACNTNWTNPVVSNFDPLQLKLQGCSVDADYVTCDFRFLLPGIFSPRFQVEAPNIAYSFRAFDRASIEISRDDGLTWASATLFNYDPDIRSDGSMRLRFNVQFELLALAPRALIRLPHPKDALLPDPRAAWFLGNAWDRYTYYAISAAATADPSGASCDPADVTACLRVDGMPSPSNDKRMVLTLMGPRAIPPKGWPSANVSDYMEGQNADPTDRRFETKPVTATFNDRVAACPFSYTNALGAPVTICN